MAECDGECRGTDDAGVDALFEPGADSCSDCVELLLFRLRVEYADGIVENRGGDKGAVEAVFVNDGGDRPYGDKWLGDRRDIADKESVYAEGISVTELRAVSSEGRVCLNSAGETWLDCGDGCD